jgi:FKBP-type peptidyl-prolyl cis-trans isomerase
MRNTTALIALLGMLTPLVAAQTSPKKSVPAHPSTIKKSVPAHPTSGPTKVTGDPTKTPSGLEFWDIKLGTGPTAQKGQTVKMNYTGWLTTGKKFDSSVGAPPFEFTLGAGEVIKGWDEGVDGMKVGGKRQLKIPPDLAYGDRGAAGVIPPGATLIFDVELLGVQ